MRDSTFIFVLSTSLVEYFSNTPPGTTPVFVIAFREFIVRVNAHIILISLVCDYLVSFALCTPV